MTDNSHARRAAVLRELDAVPYLPLAQDSPAYEALQPLTSHPFPSESDGLPLSPIDVPVGKARNAYRATGAAAALIVHAGYNGTAGAPLEQAIRDLLSDLMHLSDLLVAAPGERWSFGELLTRARHGYAEETRQRR